MSDTLQAVIVKLSGENLRNHQVNLTGTLGLFPDDSLGGNDVSVAGKPISLHVNRETVQTDIDEKKAVFRERAAIRRFFEAEAMAEGDLVMIQRLGEREFHVSRVAKRIFNHYL